MNCESCCRSLPSPIPSIYKLNLGNCILDTVKFISFFFLIIAIAYILGTVLCEPPPEEQKIFSCIPTTIEQMHEGPIQSGSFNKGIVSLDKGLHKVECDGITDKDVIIVSRKSIKGNPGTILSVRDIENGSFSILSSCENDIDNPCKSDNGEVYWIKV